MGGKAGLSMCPATGKSFSNYRVRISEGGETNESGPYHIGHMGTGTLCHPVTGGEKYRSKVRTIEEFVGYERTTDFSVLRLLKIRM